MKKVIGILAAIAVLIVLGVSAFFISGVAHSSDDEGAQADQGGQEYLVDNDEDYGGSGGSHDNWNDDSDTDYDEDLSEDSSEVSGGQSSHQTHSKESKQESKDNAKANTCTVNVSGVNYTVKVKKNDNAYTVLKRTHVTVSARKSQYGIYVEGINGKYEFDEGPGSGWCYTINGDLPMVSADSCPVKKGDIVRWYYVKTPPDL